MAKTKRVRIEMSLKRCFQEYTDATKYRVVRMSQLQEMATDHSCREDSAGGVLMMMTGGGGKLTTGEVVSRGR